MITRNQLLRRGVAEIIVEAELNRLLESGEPLRLKQGFDPSRPDIHLGHVVGLRKLRQFQELGHKVILIVGDWTAQIGDPSGQSVTRPMLTHQEVLDNAESYMKQFFKVVDRQRTEVRWQSEWFQEFRLKDVIALTSRFTVAQLTAREDFARRLQESRPVAVTELLYPLLQAYDSVMIQADVEFGGTDQKFNCLVGRELQGMMGQRPQQVFLVPILPGTDGKRKMSKSLGNYIGVDEPPQEMFGKVMSIPDDLILPYLELLTDVPDGELEEMGQALASHGVNPMELKKRLAVEIVSRFHSPQAAQEARAEFERVYQRREVPEELPEFRISFKTLRAEAQAAAARPPSKIDHEMLDNALIVGISDASVAAHPSYFLVNAGLVRSRSEAKRLIAQGAVEINGKRVTENDVVISVKDGDVIRVGKQRFVRVVDADKAGK